MSLTITSDPDADELLSTDPMALLIGIICGTYSSIYVASPLVYYMDNYLKQREAKGSGRSAKPATA